MGEELEAGQQRGEIATVGTNQADLSGVPDGNTRPATLPELGLTRKEAAGYKALAKPSAEHPGRRVWAKCLTCEFSIPGRTTGRLPTRS